MERRAFGEGKQTKKSAPLLTDNGNKKHSNKKHYTATATRATATRATATAARSTSGTKTSGASTEVRRRREKKRFFFPLDRRLSPKKTLNSQLLPFPIPPPKKNRQLQPRGLEPGLEPGGQLPVWKREQPVPLLRGVERKRRRLSRFFSLLDLFLFCPLFLVLSSVPCSLFSFSPTVMNAYFYSSVSLHYLRIDFFDGRIFEEEERSFTVKREKEETKCRADSAFCLSLTSPLIFFFFLLVHHVFVFLSLTLSRTIRQAAIPLL